jgi:hypothetical protein
MMWIIFFMLALWFVATIICDFSFLHMSSVALKWWDIMEWKLYEQSWFLVVETLSFYGENCLSVSVLYSENLLFVWWFPSEKLDDKILRKYVRKYVDDIFVEFDEQPSIDLILINIDTHQYFFNIFQYFIIHNAYIISEKK